MEIDITYPKIPHRRLVYLMLRKIILACYAVAFVACGIVNLCVGGYPWSLIVFAGQWLFWISVIERPLVEFTFMSKFSAILINVCIFLVIIDLIFGKGFTRVVVPIICFSMLIVQSLVFFIGFKRQKGNIMPLFLVITIGLIALALALIGIIEMNWPTIVFGAIAFVVLITCLSLFFKPLRRELAKKFHVN
ncbi:MAG: DUF6320 domain-containing protein [Eubacteriales bacterium]|nr:DUF6320 domain-containing protein [Eubacteriales bacterium]